MSTAMIACTPTMMVTRRRIKPQGADVIKVDASKSIREGGDATMTTEQLQAAGGEATAQELRSVVHAHSADAAPCAANAGCTQGEHGVAADNATRTAMVQHGTFFDPQCGLVFRHYLDNTRWFEGIGTFDAVGVAFGVGFAADLLATDGDPSQDLEASQRVSFVMRMGTVYRNDGANATAARRAAGAFRQ
ncbi:hypothetical protein [Gemmatimonas sp.]|jgi:imidazolonepropionase-like amidohydrolase|uniref:hypothetical protein n=2 Tax=Gemmatimonas sp. TaxID=1962908 RepID=UPI0037C1683F